MPCLVYRTACVVMCTCMHLRLHTAWFRYVACDEFFISLTLTSGIAPTDACMSYERYLIAQLTTVLTLSDISKPLLCLTRSPVQQST